MTGVSSFAAAFGGGVGSRLAPHAVAAFLPGGTPPATVEGRLARADATLLRVGAARQSTARTVGLIACGAATGLVLWLVFAGRRRRRANREVQHD